MSLTRAQIFLPDTSAGLVTRQLTTFSLALSHLFNVRTLQIQHFLSRPKSSGANSMVSCYVDKFSGLMPPFKFGADSIESDEAGTTFQSVAENFALLDYGFSFHV